ncbi:Tetraspanin-31 [Acropora cervicornis]|uniref:Tetraspanin-31 n=1 Tax=Acropora cervicornis TaxID=6130 RepID=A0AAD9V4Y7_ACRCE|nr:Tetraspanin-31 [Acropora cervicornis]
MYSPKYSKAQSCAYFCSKNVLVALNTLYIFIALVLIGVAVYAKASAKITSLPILGGVIALAISHNRQADLMKAGWQKIPNKSSIKEQIQSARNCCGFQNKSLPVDVPLGHPDCRALFGVCMTYRYRHQRDPRANPGAFL